MKNLLLLVIISALLFSSCKTEQPLVTLNDDTVPILCGTFKTSKANLGKEEAAIIAYQKACDGGHMVGRMVIRLMNKFKN